jgi:cytoskeleton protein RodZ
MSDSRSDDRGVGARLRSARERRRMTILQAAERLHVDPDILEALEADNFAALGAPVYLKGHLRHYAELVGESPEALQSLIASGPAPLPPPDLTRAPRPAQEDSRGLAGSALLVVLVFAVAGTAWWVMSLSHHGPGAPGPVPALTRAAPPTAGAPGPLALTEPGRSAALGSAPGAPTHGAPGALTPTTYTAGGPMRLRLTFSAASWVEVYDEANHRLLYGLVATPGVRTAAGRPPVRVLLGNAPGVALEVDGRAASFAPFVRANHSAQFVIAPDGRLLPAAAPAKGG